VILHRAFGAEAFHLPIEYALPVVLALLLLPLWPGCMGLTSLLRQAMSKGRGGKLGMILEMRSALASDNLAERRMAMKTLWCFAYIGLLAGAWIAYAAMLGYLTRSARILTNPSKTAVRLPACTRCGWDRDTPR